MSLLVLVAGQDASHDGWVTDLKDRPTKPLPGRMYGWLSGVGLLIVPWIMAGVISTFSGDPESFFPKALLGVFVVMVGWLVYGCARIPGFRRPALLGSAFAVAVVAFLYLLALGVQAF